MRSSRCPPSPRRKRRSNYEHRVIVTGVRHRRDLLLLLPLLVSAQPPGERSVVSGWTRPDPAEYEAVIDHKVVHSGHGSLVLRSTGSNPKDFAAKQQIRA